VKCEKRWKGDSPNNPSMLDSNDGPGRSRSYTPTNTKGHPMSNGKIITSTEVRLSFEHLLTPQAQKNDDGTMGDPAYSTMLLIPKSDTETVEGIREAPQRAP